MEPPHGFPVPLHTSCWHIQSPTLHMEPIQTTCISKIASTHHISCILQDPLPMSVFLTYHKTPCSCPLISTSDAHHKPTIYSIHSICVRSAFQVQFLLDSTYSSCFLLLDILFHLSSLLDLFSSLHSLISVLSFVFLFSMFTSYKTMLKCGLINQFTTTPSL